LCERGQDFGFVLFGKLGTPCVLEFSDLALLEFNSSLEHV